MNIGTAIAAGLLVLTACVLFPRIARTETLPDSAVDVLAARDGWNALPPAVLQTLGERLTPVSAKELADLCDRTGITENNIRALAAKYADSPGFIVGGIATTLTSYANAVGDRGDYRAARRALMLAVTLKPRHVSAWMSLALCEYQLRDCTASSGWATKVLQFEPDPESDDPWEQGLALALSPEGERIAAEALGAPDMVGAWRQMQDQMRAIVTACERMAAR